MDSGIITSEVIEMNETEREQWERFLGTLDFYRSWSPSKDFTIIMKTKLKGNEYTYDKLLHTPCFTMAIGRDRHGKYFEGWYSNQTNVARIIWNDTKIKNYQNDDRGKEAFIRDFCELVSQEREGEVDYMILDLDILPEFVKRVNEAVENREKK